MEGEIGIHLINSNGNPVITLKMCNVCSGQWKLNNGGSDFNANQDGLQTHH